MDCSWLFFSGVGYLFWVLVTISVVAVALLDRHRSYVLRRIVELGGELDYDDWDDWHRVTLTDNEVSWCLRNLAFVRSITSLSLSSTSIADADAKYLRSHRKSLEMLGVSDTNISDDFVRALSRFPRLWSLNLARTRISDEVIAVLAAMPNLQSVDLSGTDCTVEGIDRLRRLKPKCTVITGFIDDRFKAE